MYDDEESEWDKMYEKMRNEKALMRWQNMRISAKRMP